VFSNSPRRETPKNTTKTIREKEKNWVDFFESLSTGLADKHQKHPGKTDLELELELLVDFFVQGFWHGLL
jgi:hypothetical protein